MPSKTVSNLTTEQLGSGKKPRGRPRKTVCDQQGDGVADLAIKALSHLIPALLAKFGEKGGEVLSSEAIEFARKKGLLSKKATPVQDGGAYSGDVKATPLAKEVKGKPKASKKFLEGEKVVEGVLVKHKISGPEHFGDKGITTSFSLHPEILPVPKRKQRGKGAIYEPPIGGGTYLAGKGTSLAGDGILLAGESSMPPQKRRGRPPKVQSGEGCCAPCSSKKKGCCQRKK